MTLLAVNPESKAIYTRAQNDSRKWDPRLEKTSKVGCGTYRVEGRHGTYTVTVSAEGFACNCIAGINLLTCWHCGSAYRARLVEKMNRRPVTATPAKAPVPSWDALYGAA